MSDEINPGVAAHGSTAPLSGNNPAQVPGAGAPANLDPAAAPQVPAQGQQPQPAPQVPADPAAAPAAPAAPLVEPPKVEVDQVASEDLGDGTVAYQPTGDAALDVALGFIGNLGIDGTDPAVVAAANGEFALLEAKLATLGDKAQGWQQMVNLAKDAYQRAQVRFKDHVEKTDKAILGVVQSADNWNAIKAWAASNATPEEKAAVNAMIDAGPVQARAAATLLLNAYRKATGTVINPASPTRTNASGEAPTDNGGKLSPREYSQAVADLHRKLGSRMESSPEYRALRQRLAR